MPQVFIVAGCRTPIGKFQGQFEKFSGAELGSIAIAEAIKRANLTPNDVQHVIMGQVLTAGQGQNPARQAASLAKVPEETASYTINMMCGSGLKAIALGFQSIRDGEYDVVVAGGQESMTRAHHSAYIRNYKLGNSELKDTVIHDGLTDVTHRMLMGNTAERLAVEYQVARSEQDAYAAESQKKAETAIKSGWFDKEIISIPAKGTGKMITADEFPRFGTEAAQLALLKSCFSEQGTVTAGNSSGINDGAAAVVLCTVQQVEMRNLEALARIVGYAEVGVEPLTMGIAPCKAIDKLLSKIGWTADQVDLFEINEAFAVFNVICGRKMRLPEEKINVSGGAIALGHPIGCSGARILVTLIHNLRRLNKRKGVAALCIGGGMGIAMAIEVC